MINMNMKKMKRSLSQVYRYNRLIKMNISLFSSDKNNNIDNNNTKMKSTQLNNQINSKILQSKSFNRFTKIPQPSQTVIKKQKQQHLSQQQQVIQISKQQFQQMKKILEQMKEQMNNIQQQEQLQQNNKQNKKKYSKMLDNMSMKNIQQKQLFFKLQQQKLSFKLMQIHTKQQLIALAIEYLNKYNRCKQQQLSQSNKQPMNKQTHTQLPQLSRCLYLIFFKYFQFPCTYLCDIPIKQTTLIITQNIHHLSEQQLRIFLEIVNDNISKVNDMKTKYKNNHLNDGKRIAEKEIIKMEEMKKKIIETLMKTMKYVDKKEKSNINTEIISLLYHLGSGENKQLIDKYHKQIQTHYELFSYKQYIPIIYNPLNLSHIIISSSQQNKTQYKKLFLSSLEHQLSHHIQSDNNDSKQYILQQSIKHIDNKKYTNLKFQSVVYLIENYQANNEEFIREVIAKVFSNTKIITNNLPVINKLRIIYSLLIKIQQSSQYQSSYQQQHYNFIISNLSQLLRHSKLRQITNKQLVQQFGLSVGINQKGEFIYYKKLIMLLNQVSIELYKYQRKSNHFIRSNNDNNNNINININIEQISIVLSSSLNAIKSICMDKVHLNDLFININNQQHDQQHNQQHKNHGKQYLVFDLTLFQFIVNFNIVIKWVNGVKQKNNNNVNNNDVNNNNNINNNVNSNIHTQQWLQLLQKLIKLQLNRFKLSHMTQNLSQHIHNTNTINRQQQLTISQNLLIILLISKSYHPSSSYKIFINIINFLNVPIYFYSQGDEVIFLDEVVKKLECDIVQYDKERGLQHKYKKVCEGFVKQLKLIINDNTKSHQQIQ